MQLKGTNESTPIVATHSAFFSICNMQCLFTFTNLEHCLIRLLEVAETQLQETAAGQLRSTYCNLTNPALTISLEGFADGKGSEWRHAFGLVGARTFGEKELQKLAFNQQAATTA